MIPKIKKRVNSFLVGEEGKISKKSILRIGVIFGIATLGSTLLVSDASAQCSACDPPAAQSGCGLTHCNPINWGNYNPGSGISVSHKHHSSHGSHASHGSHCSSKYC